MLRFTGQRYTFSNVAVLQQCRSSCLSWISRYKVEAQGSWEHLATAEYRDSYALGSLGDTLYLLGGQMRLKNQYLITNCVERWSLQGGPWRSAAPLPLPLAYHSVVRINDRLYVMGGRTPQVVFPLLLAFNWTIIKMRNSNITNTSKMSQG